jgi:ribosomal protein S18 acetylase RimI-like enzyme
VSVTLRRFDPSRDDPTALRALHERALRDAGTDPGDVPGTEDLGRVPGTYLDGGEFLVGYEGDDLVAMGGFRPVADLPAGGHEGFDDGVDPERAVELFRIAVAPGAQGRGLGSRVLAELESRAAAADYDRVVLTTAARQRAGLALYRSRAYEEVGRLRDGGYELVRFRKRLGESGGRESR